MTTGEGTPDTWEGLYSGWHTVRCGYNQAEYGDPCRCGGLPVAALTDALNRLDDAYMSPTGPSVDSIVEAVVRVLNPATTKGTSE